MAPQQGMMAARKRRMTSKCDKSEWIKTINKWHESMGWTFTPWQGSWSEFHSRRWLVHLLTCSGIQVSICLISPLRWSLAMQVLYSLMLYPGLMKGQWRKINPSPCLLICQGQMILKPRSTFLPPVHSAKFWRVVRLKIWVYLLTLLPLLAISHKEDIS